MHARNAVELLLFSSDFPVANKTVLATPVTLSVDENFIEKPFQVIPDLVN
jgi:hypothetical protein